MRFSTVTKVKVQDAERVLAVLEQRLRTMVSDVERDGNRITLLGLGPSSRAINRHDTTVIDVWAEGGETAIGADVTFQASAFLGETGQEEIMRLKLERLFEETREQLDLESRHDVARIARMEALVSGSSASTRVADAPRQQPSPEVTLAEEKPATATQAEKPARQDAKKTQPDSERAGPSAAAATAAAERSMADADDEELDDTGYALDEADEHGSNRWILWAALAACLAAALPFIAHYLSTWREGRQTAATQPAAEPQPAATGPAKPVAAAEPADLLRQWELAMQSRDAAAQASFYSVPVERYFLRYNVNKAQVEADKRWQIANRRGDWTVKMERVRINRTADNAATVNLVKHYTQREEGRPVKEWSVPSQLKLKSEFGVWWITSERDFFGTDSSGAP